MNSKIYSLATVVLLTVLFGCYPGGAEYVNEYDITYSNYDNTYNFVSKGTYSLPDKIMKIKGDVISVNPQPPEYVKDIYATPILAQIDANMSSLGWTKVDVNSNPDVQLLPATWESTTIIYGGYWGGYWCWYYPYYCTGGGWYYPYVPVTTYTTGTLVMSMVDPNAESTDSNRRVVWTGAINGLLAGTYDPSRVSKGIDQAFKQSPYLKTN
ncbi:MAG TPA: DUF4136 domain-containing protein [Cyclobacteriaceae bacterium]|jgi:hypothetical protein|nr:DUF4136 domain-containing protein [Cyclobacteriaceae bacterium]